MFAYREKNVTESSQTASNQRFLRLYNGYFWLHFKSKSNFYNVTQNSENPCSSRD